MNSYILSACSSVKSVFTGKLKWYAILFYLWLYRVTFMPDVGWGVGKIIQSVCLIMFGWLLLSKHGRIIPFTYQHTNSPVKSMFLLYIFAVISVTWAYLPSFALFMSLQNIVAILSVMWVFSRIDNFYSRERAFVFFMLSMVVFEFVCGRLVNGFSLFKHQLPTASSAAICLCYCFTEYISADKQAKGRRGRRTFLRNSAWIAMVALIMSTSSGANVSALFGCAVGMFFSRKKVYGLIAVACAFFLYLNQDLIDSLLNTLMAGKTKEEIQNVNGREFLWVQLNRIADERPVLGWGFACLERVNRYVFEGQVLSDAHSNYVGMRGSLGYVGLGMLVYHFMRQTIYTFRRRRMIGQLGLLCATCCAILNGYSYGFLSGKTCSITICYICVVVMTFLYSQKKYGHTSVVK